MGFADIIRLRRRYDNRAGRRDQLRSQLADVEQDLKRLRRQARIVEKAQQIVRLVAIETQKQLEYRIASTVSAAEEAVFGEDAYELGVTFTERRGRTECDLRFVRDGQELDPLASTGYGTVDIAAFALRVACWSMGAGSAPVLVLDEPFKHLKGSETNRRAIHMVHQVAKELGLQVIMISDERAPIEDIKEGADRVFRVTMRSGSSHVETLD